MSMQEVTGEHLSWRNDLRVICREFTVPQFLCSEPVLIKVISPDSAKVSSQSAEVISKLASKGEAFTDVSQVNCST